ncbi:E3 ubiquitin-protein ligase HAKAI homolog [Eucalyptus grandis]|uniref:E3 ubiquitin-protein ligase HAKAI homolog n=1 Tax=Eucalyptus grandis TaxID=71139 RepID=UPI00192ED62D|nr:E3 ubiquitin-protein ligase HAKAI homolog [Eucalyptus grandis]
MLQIRLKRDPIADGGGGLKPSPAETVTVACPDHLVLADLPVAKGLGSAAAASVVKPVGRKSRRQLGERVHFCVRCDFPIAIYGRLSPCEHAFCLDCARSDSICYLCDERIQKIQTIKMMEGLFICAAPHCLKSFLKKSEFESHIHETHVDLLQPNAEKEDGNESDARSIKQSTASESTARAPPRPVISPGSSQLHDRDDKARHQHGREQPPPRPIMHQKPPAFLGQAQNNPSDSQADNRLPGFDRRFHMDVQGGPQQESSHFPEKQPGVLSDSPFQEYPLHSMQQPNFVVPLQSNQMLTPPPPFGFPPYPIEGAQPFFPTPYDTVRQDSAPEGGPEPGSLLGFPPGPPGGVNFMAGYPQPWNTGMAAPFEPPTGGQGAGDAYANPADVQGRVPLYQGDYMRNAGTLPLNPPPPPPLASKGMETARGGSSVM